MLRYFTLLAILCYSGSAAASVVINSTRVIYPQDTKVVNVQLVNKSTTPHLVQSWIDDGNPSVSPEKIDVPFSVAPAVVQIGTNEGQILKLMSRDAALLPKDRESVFWLNVLDVPPVPEVSEDKANYLQVALRSRVKLFYRPNDLKVKSDDIDQHLSVRHQDGKFCLNNKSPYYVTLMEMVTWQGGDIKKTVKANLLSDTAFIAPFNCYALPSGVSGNSQYRIARMNDFGSKHYAVISSTL
ncbi:fimbria/pilus periplasmic chaperone [Klebsiella sp. RHBSTW-00484]|uniref:fimbrial biogenesis chaperone n=1 Tax=unclassified Klebsiella TaxID=2608929 RepID=UPI0015E4C850|nr:MULTISPECIES: fimbria/pilus periplasmic chaperone [unclassified Klebsiella]MBA7845655.1 fimbria/pilus periplasmic chaperone [Klebsiella sp. RHBSTW-00465]QLO38403.1 fimbria/pilus periplasmic chaperone [Klebsiella sp. RHBSTW-00484]QLT77923.1 fimbria/pilus periplasmic chaperone [Klebsiella sp. RHBSTW-00464]